MRSDRPATAAVSWPQRLRQGCPWFTIALLVHVVVLAVASVVYFARQALVDDPTPTQVALLATPPKDEWVPPLVVRTHDVVPPIAEVDIETSLGQLDAPDELGTPSEASGPPESTTDGTSDTMPANTAIGLRGPGFTGADVSVGHGPGVPAKYRERMPQRGGPPGRARIRDQNESMQRALAWLAAHQDEDGHWDTANFMKHDTVGVPCTGAGNPVHDVGITGLALLAFLGDGHTLREGPYRKVVRAGVRWLGEQQREDGLFGMPSSEGYLYSHAIATLAMCEAFGLSDYKPLRAKAQAGINFIAQARNPYGVWRYQPRSGDSDTSITGWMVQALLSGKEFGLQVDAQAFTAALVYFDEVTDPATGAAGYTRRGEGSSRPVGAVDRFPAAKTEAMTAVVLLCRCLLHQEPKEVPVMLLAADTLGRKPPVWNEADGSIDMYYWYYASFALFQVGGRHWEQWNRQMSGAVVRSQRLEGNARGSWDPVDAWGQDGGRVYSTAMMALCLQAYFRYARVLGGRA